MRLLGGASLEMPGWGLWQDRQAINIIPKGSGAEGIASGICLLSGVLHSEWWYTEWSIFFSKSRAVFLLLVALMAHLKGRSLGFACGWIQITSGLLCHIVNPLFSSSCFLFIKFPVWIHVCISNVNNCFAHRSSSFYKKRAVSSYMHFKLHFVDKHWNIVFGSMRNWVYSYLNFSLPEPRTKLVAVFLIIYFLRVLLLLTGLSGYIGMFMEGNWYAKHAVQTIIKTPATP